MADEKAKPAKSESGEKPGKDTKAQVKKAVKKDKKPNVFKRIGKFFKELKSEVSKVVWPSPKQVVNNTVTVLVITIISAAFVGVIDWLFKTAVSLVIK